MPHTPIHIATKKKPLKKNLHPYTNFDRVVLVVAVLYPFSALPQIIAVFSGRTEGVALISWIFFLLCSLLFLVYGLRRRVPPMIVANSIWSVMDVLVIVGILLHSPTISLM
jgi:uncharacterized protein with PQ loop repeat